MKSHTTDTNFEIKISFCDLPSNKTFSAQNSKNSRAFTFRNMQHTLTQFFHCLTCSNDKTSTKTPVAYQKRK